MTGPASTVATLLASAIVGASIGASHVMMLRVRHRNEDQAARNEEQQALAHHLYVAQQRFALLDLDRNGQADFCGDLERLREETKTSSEEWARFARAAIELVVTPDRRGFCFTLPSASPDGPPLTINHLGQERLLLPGLVIDRHTCTVVPELERRGDR